MLSGVVSALLGAGSEVNMGNSHTSIKCNGLCACAVGKEVYFKIMACTDNTINSILDCTMNKCH